MNSELLELHSFWNGKRVLITGHSGFKGSWLAIWLNHLGSKVTGISLPPLTSPSLYSVCNLEKICNSHFCDVRDYEALVKKMRQSDPEIIFHLAAQPLVRKSYLEPLSTFDTNVMGTANLLNSMRELTSIKSAVIVTTDKVYENLEHSRPYSETDSLGGYDPYSASKAASEIVVSSYRRSFLTERGVAISSARAGNILGGGDWSEDRLLPDAIRAWQNQLTLKIRYPNSVRPWQHVLEPLYGYMLLAKAQYETFEVSGAYNFGPEPDLTFTVQDVVRIAQANYGSGTVEFSNMDGQEIHEAGLLSLDIQKSKSVLNFNPIWPLEKTIKKSVDWYQRYFNNEDALQLCLMDIHDYLNEIGAR